MDAFGNELTFRAHRCFCKLVDRVAKNTRLAGEEQQSLAYVSHRPAFGGKCAYPLVTVGSSSTGHALRTLNAATLYPGVCLIEGTNVSVGRGTDTPFEVFGAPWVRPVELADYLNRREIQGIRFVPTTFTPNASKYANQALGGVYMVVTDRNTLEAVEMGVELASALRTLYPNEFQMDQMILLLGNQAAFDALKAGVDPRRIAADWQDDVDKFKEIRKKYLLY